MVESSIGHIRDLPTKTADIPAAFRKKSWARLGVDIEQGFKPIYVVPPEKRAQVKKLKALLAEASEVYLATDEDREGEAIAWHLVEVLKPSVPIKRMVFHEITKRAIEQAFATPRDIDERLVGAQEARRILDRLYGYEVSPVLWRKVRPRLSAGRVQSVATRLVVERERARRAFHSGDFWSIGATIANGGTERFGAELQEIDGRRIAVGRHFDPETGELSRAACKDGVLRLDQVGAEGLAQSLDGEAARVVEVLKKPFTQRPYPPFITSTLQQEAGRKLGFAAKRTMRVAQRLYESGYITYMRTDSTQLSQEALGAARKAVATLYGAEYLPETARVYSKKVKGAQEAHEAIRPAGESFRSPDTLRNELDAEALRLYELIWKRTVASQMKDALGERTQVRVAVTVPAPVVSGNGDTLAGDAIFSASGKVITFAGYLRAYVRGSDDPEADLDDKERYLPAVAVGDVFAARELAAREHATQPPARFTEAALVKMLEELGIGRPSTYATIIQTIQDRGYVWKQGNTLVPTLTAFAVVNLLEQHFGELVDYAFTAKMESDLDLISDGKKESTPWLEGFYFGRGDSTEAPPADKGSQEGSLRAHGLRGLIGNGVEHIDARDVCSLYLGTTADGTTITARVGRYGPYLQVGDSERRANIADDVLLDELDAEKAEAMLSEADMANRELGRDPESDKPVYIKSGAFGPYVQLGDPELTPKGNIKKDGKPKMASLWPSMSVQSITLADAMLLLSYPKTLGAHPEHGAPITAHDGRFGPYIQCEHEGKRDTRSLADHEELRSVGLARALELFAQPRQSRAQRAVAKSLIAELGESPTTGKAITVRDGRFGPYVTDGQVNATIPNNRDPQKITFELALELIASREQTLREQGVDPRAPKPAGTPVRRKSTKKATKKVAKKATKKAGVVVGGKAAGVAAEVSAEAPKKKAGASKASAELSATS